VNSILLDFMSSGEEMEKDKWKGKGKEKEKIDMIL
jgi:hypothetical protein